MPVTLSFQTSNPSCILKKKLAPLPLPFKVRMFWDSWAEVAACLFLMAFLMMKH